MLEACNQMLGALRAMEAIDAIFDLQLVMPWACVELTLVQHPTAAPSWVINGAAALIGHLGQRRYHPARHFRGPVVLERGPGIGIARTTSCGGTSSLL
jgi:hypothetical protein